jgi:uncharacterized protein (DUF305 family)
LIKDFEMKTNRSVALLTMSLGIVLSSMALDASAQQSGTIANGQMHMSEGQMPMPAHTGSALSASTRAFKQNAANMMKNMSAPGYTGDTDADFVAHMIPHHQGAVDQAEVELRYGHDPEMRALAKKIIKAQREEIFYMRQWQAKHNNKM